MYGYLFQWLTYKTIASSFDVISWMLDPYIYLSISVITIIKMAEMRVILLGLATSNEGDAYGL